MSKVNHIKKAKLEWSDLWDDLGMEKDRAGRWYPGDTTPDYVQQYIDNNCYRTPSRAYPYSYATPLLTVKFAKYLCEKDPELAVSLGVGEYVN